MLDEILTYIFTKFWSLYINIMLRRKGKKGVNKNMKEVYGIIRKLGLTSKYKGYYYLAEAVNMVMEQKEEQMRITKDIYPGLSKKFKSTPSNIERDIRTVINTCWETNKDGLDKIAGYPLKFKPTNSEFIDMIAYYLTEEDAVEANVG